MKTLKLILLTCSFFAAFYLNAQTCDNICMDFDGVDDEISSPVLIGASNFTIEMWYLSSDTSTNVDPLINFRRLFTFSGSPNTLLQVGLSGGEITIEWADSFGGTLPVTNIPSTQNVGQWNHLAVTRNGQDITVFLNCQPIWTDTLVNNWNIGGFVLGPLTGIATIEKHWLGQVDDVRIWNFPKTQLQIEEQKHCVLSGNETDLALYYTFDEGIANSNNTALSSVVDLSPNALNGNLNNFTLTGANSNFVNSTAGLVYPNYNGLGLNISDYPYMTAPLTEICNGEPAHFCLDKNGSTPPPDPNITVVWEHSDDAGITWTPDSNPPFNDFCFAMPAGNLNTICAGDPEGFVDRQYRAISQVTDPVLNETCDYISQEEDLRICCPISPATITIAPNDPLCENETLTVTVTLNSPDQFVTTPGSMTTIDWFYDDGTGGGAVNIGFANQTTFTYTITTPNIPSPGSPLQICFSAEINHCTKSATVTECLTVDPEPICGNIIGLPTPNTLTLVGTTPHMTYDICPGNDAALGIDPANPFFDCIPEWQYSFDDITWSSMGYSNTQQNTNILPTIQPPVPWPTGTTSIFYRIKCNPLSSPSGCDPCFSDKIEVQLRPDPIVSSIGGVSLACKEDLPVTLSVAANPAYSYTWYCDGLPVGTGSTYDATQQACYWVETSNGCIFTESAPYCLTVCEIVPIISCPESPNECAKLGEPITLNACASYITCDNGNTPLTFSWVIDGVADTTITSCTMPPHIPLATGSLYEVTVTDPFHGCSATTSRFVVPCDFND